MADAGETRTVGLKRCGSCRAGLIETDRYCRWCGMKQEPKKQEESSLPLHGAAVTRRSLTKDHSDEGAVEVRGRTVSGPLVNAIVAGVSSSSRSLRLGRKTRRVMAVLVSAPVLLIVVLLAPIDAYLAIKDISSEISSQ